jgi:L-threonylcarbamoyladenylate synthase
MILPDSETVRAKAAEVISQGGLIAFLTDTFYGLGADPFNAKAVARIRELKGREDHKPILLLLSDERQVGRFIAEQSSVFAAVTKRSWPGPLTIVGPARDELPEELTAGSGTIGVRLPDDARVRAFVRACGGALTATSANSSGQTPARSARDVEGFFPTGIDLIIDAGEARATKPSTVLDLSGPQPRVIREGAIAKTELEAFWSNEKWKMM